MNLSHFTSIFDDHLPKVSALWMVWFVELIGWYMFGGDCCVGPIVTRTRHVLCHMFKGVYKCTTITFNFWLILFIAGTHL